MNSLESATLKNVPRLLGRNSQGKSVRDTIWPNLQSLGGEEGWEGGGFRLSKLKCWKLYQPPCLCLLEYNIDTAPLSHMASVFHKAGREMQFCRIRTSIFFLGQLWPQICRNQFPREQVTERSIIATIIKSGKVSTYVVVHATYQIKHPRSILSLFHNIFKYLCLMDANYGSIAQNQAQRLI